MAPRARLLELIEREPTDEIWQEAIRVSEFIYTERRYEEAFQITMDALAMAKHEDTVMALSTCLFEHLLGYDFSYFDRMERQINEGDDKLLHALKSCSKFGLSKVEANARRWDSLIEATQDRWLYFKLDDS